MPKWMRFFAFLCLAAGVDKGAHAGTVPPRNSAVVGQSQWLYYSNEWQDAPALDQTAQTLQSLQRLRSVLEDAGVVLELAMVPTKVRTYPEFVPAALEVSQAMRERYATLLAALRQRGVGVVDLNAAFQSALVQEADGALSAPLFYRLDSHWSQQGALVAAKAVQQKWQQESALKAVLDGGKPVAYTLIRGRVPVRGGDDLTQLLPKSAKERLTPERVRPMVVQRDGVSVLPGTEWGRSASDLVVVGSSYSLEWTGFVPYLRYALQRDVANFSLDATQGPWYALLRYFSDAAYAESSAKALLLEIPERDMHAGPAYPNRELRYRFAPDTWALWVAAWAAKECPRADTVAFVRAPFTGEGDSASVAGIWRVRGREGAVEVQVAPSERTYVQMLVRLHHATAVRFGAAGKGGGNTWEVAREPDQWHRVRVPMAEGGVAKVELAGTVQGDATLEVREVQVCAHPRDYLQ